MFQPDPTCHAMLKRKLIKWGINKRSALRRMKTTRLLLLSYF